MKLRIGIIFDFSRKWMGGIYYYKSLIRSFDYLEKENQPEIILFYSPAFEEYINDLEYDYVEKVLLKEPLQIGIPKRFIYSLISRKNHFDEELSDQYSLDGIYAVNDYPIRVNVNQRTKVAAWIPDLQHDFFPQFFDYKRRILRKARLKFMLRNGSNLIVSSNDVRKNFYEAFKIPDTIKIHTVRFSSINPPQNFDKSVLNKYKIGSKYFIVCNQFLQHKNHIVVFKALKIAVQADPSLLVVVTGNTNAYNQKNYFDELKEYIFSNGISKQVIITGLIAREEQLTLIKYAEALIQPSKFEGWSTSIEDAKSINTPVIASKLDVHYEQLKEEGVYFQPDDEGGLAQILCSYQRPNNFKFKQNYEDCIKQFAYDFLNVFNGYYHPAPKIVHINASIAEGSTGRIFKKISDVSFSKGFISYLAFGRWKNKIDQKNYLYIGNKLNLYLHGLMSLLFDRHGFGSYLTTKRLISRINRIQPQIIQLHSLHGYFININVLFNYLKSQPQIKVIWTQHDCWSFTGHCGHYEDIGCDKFETLCHKCPKVHKYPKSLWRDNSKRNYLQKKKILTGLSNLHLIAPSKWLENQFGRSFLKDYKVFQIYNGIDLEIFRPYQFFEFSKEIKDFKTRGLKIVLGVSNAWSNAKGIQDIYHLAEKLGETYLFVIVGVDNLAENKPLKNLKLIKKTEEIKELAMWYSAADVFINPTYLDTFPTTNIESLACGTPVITYASGGSTEAINDETGIAVRRGDKEGLEIAIKEMCSRNRNLLSDLCRKRAVENFSQEVQFEKYIDIYNELLKI